MNWLKFATEHVIGIEEQWDCVHFSSESYLTCSIVMGEGSFDIVLRNDIRLSALKAVLNLEEEVWRCLAWFLLLIQDLLSGYMVKLMQMYTKRYWRNIFLPNLRTAINQTGVFMQDNALCHTMKSVKTSLSEEGVTVMEWPTQTPHMNPIESVWKLLNERAKEKNQKNVEDLWTNLKAEWEKISVDKCTTLIHSCSKIYQAVIESKALHVKY